LFTFTDEIALVLETFPLTAMLELLVVELLEGHEIVTTGAACAANAIDAKTVRAVKNFNIMESILEFLQGCQSDKNMTRQSTLISAPL
jgi:hypothetical protein